MKPRAFEVHTAIRSLLTPMFFLLAIILHGVIGMYLTQTTPTTREVIVLFKNVSVGLMGAGLLLALFSRWGNCTVRALGWPAALGLVLGALVSYFLTPFYL